MAAARGRRRSRDRTRRAERRQRVQRDEPRRDRRREALREEGPERLVLPRLDVASRPVVHEAEAGDMCRSAAAIGIAVPERIALRDDRPDLELVVESATRPERRAATMLIVARLSARAPHRRAAGHDRRGATVVSDRHPLVVRQQRVVGTEHAPDVASRDGSTRRSRCSRRRASGGAARRLRIATSSASPIARARAAARGSRRGGHRSAPREAREAPVDRARAAD